MSKTFGSMGNASKNLMVLDAMNLAFRWKHQGAKVFAEEYVDTVQSLARSYNAKDVIICCDYGASSYRKKIYPEYKQNRKDKQALQTEAEQEYFEVFFAEFLRAFTLLAERYPSFRFKGVEADDLAAYICARRKSLPYEHIWLISSDKDWDLLVSKDVSRFSYVTRKEVTTETWSAHHDYPPEDYASIKALMGDTGDNVIGVASIGPKTASKLIAEHGSVWDIIESLPLEGKYKYIKNLNEFGADNLTINMMLVDLPTYCADAIGEENIAEINKTLELLK